jgi:hypothetical protein
MGRICASVKVGLFSIYSHGCQLYCRNGSKVTENSDCGGSGKEVLGIAKIDFLTAAGGSVSGVMSSQTVGLE